MNPILVAYVSIGAVVAIANAVDRADGPPELRSRHPWREAGMAVVGWFPVGVVIGALWVKASCGKGRK